MCSCSPASPALRARCSRARFRYSLTARLGIPIDHVAVNDGFTVVSHRKLPDFGSDHYGVVVELALRDGEHP